MRWKSLSATVALLLSLVVSAPPAVAGATDVATINWASFTATPPSDADSVRAKSILLNTNEYALTTWWNTAKNFDSQSGSTYLNFGGTGQDQIRPPASEAYALAISLKTGAYDPAVTGVATATATAAARKLAVSVAYRHKVNLTGGWGGDWQSAYWAALGGTAGWMLWADLSSTDREYVRKMVEFEADRFIGYQVPYYRNSAGTVISAGDSKAEENSWNSMILSLAVNMMPTHPHWWAWLYKLGELEVSSFARPADTSSASTLHGRKLSDWLYGSNANADGTVTNHNIIHPDYMATVDQIASGALVGSLLRRSVPTSATFNAAHVYDAWVDVSFTSPPYTSPGGTMFTPGSSAVYYPQGNDWGTDRRAHFASGDALARLFGYDNLASRNGAYWEPYHAGRVLEMQARSTDGRTYQAAGEDTYTGREEWVARQAAVSWLAKWVGKQNILVRSDNTYNIVVDDRDREFSVVAGTWTLGTYNPTAGAGILNTERYNAAGTGADKVRFTPRLPSTRNYKVYAWWNAYQNHASNAPFTIRRADGTTTTVRVDQRAGGGGWALLGTFQLAAGTASYVELSDNADNYVVADAVMFQPA